MKIKVSEIFHHIFRWSSHFRVTTCIILVDELLPNNYFFVLPHEILFDSQ